MKRRLLRILSITSLVAILLFTMAGIALAVDYYLYVKVSSEAGTSDYAPLALAPDLNNQSLADLGYISESGLDTRVTYAGSELKHMVAEDKLAFVAPEVKGGVDYSYNYTMGNDPLTEFYIVPGYDGYVTISDAAALEQGNNFEIEQKGWIDTSAGSDKNLVYKQEAFRTYISATGEVTSSITVTSEKKDEITGSGSSTWTIYDDKWSSMPITASSSYSIYKVILKSSKKVLSPGDLICEIYNTTDHKPTGSALGSGTVAEGSLPTDYADIPIILDSPVAIGNGVEYAVVYRTTTGDASNYVQTNKMGTGNDFHSKSEDNGESWVFTGTGNYGMDQEVWSPPSLDVTATGVSSGEHIIKTTADGTDLKIYVDTVEKDSVALEGVSVPDTAYDWTLNQNNVMPYMEYYKHTVGGTLIAWYQPNDMISGTTLPDREGTAQNGTFTWGSLPTGISTTIGSLKIVNLQKISKEKEEGAYLELFQEVPPEWEGMYSGEQYNVLPGSEAISELAAAGQIPIKLFWVPVIFGIAIFAGLFIYGKTRNIMAVAIAGGIVIGLFCAIGMLVWWVIIPYSIMSVALCVSEKTYGF